REDRVDLAWARTPRVGMRRDPDDGGDAKTRAHGFDVVEPAEQSDIGAAESDLLLRLAQCRRLGVAVARVARPTRECHLSLVMRQGSGPAREEQVASGVRGEQRAPG